MEPTEKLAFLARPEWNDPRCPPQIKEMLRAAAAGNGGVFQYFTFCPGRGVLWQWNINIAEALVAGRQPDGEFEVAKVTRFAEYSGARFDQEEIASEAVDLRHPIICVDMELQDAAGKSVYEGAFPIDGWHRILRAIRDGVPRLPMHLLTEEENMLCRYRETETTYEQWTALHGEPPFFGEE